MNVPNIYVKDNTLFIETEKDIKKDAPLLQFDDTDINSEYDNVPDNENYPIKDIRIEKASFSVFELKRKLDDSNGKIALEWVTGSKLPFGVKLKSLIGAYPQKFETKEIPAFSVRTLPAKKTVKLLKKGGALF